ncbi:nuclear transport factor 2 family protein [Aggregatimonas sangjinii]|uniref:Nuclear transport factor 2 family protein n=1 Tax=Aggregatimonas sangjinii TaxID=2583587 RepID=A0A5B7SNH5_9FLAO|nr:nuclear transport factor 2 family protein [Aggregatimonas sangjinii]QCX00205.1 nuclear transport factor 2 family protein [Aggregatimonas sangjinii]
MKRISLIMILVWSTIAVAQDAEEAAVQRTIESFFEHFHQQDTLGLRTTAADMITMQTISQDSIGNTVVQTMPYADFLVRIASIPKTTKFEEKLKSFSIQVDGEMANAWTPYEFWIGDAFHHCGVNSFQLVKFGKDWKIVYLIDTRRTENCD